VLAALSAGSVAGVVGVPQNATADPGVEVDEEARALLEKYRSEDRIKQAVKLYASDLLEALYHDEEVSTTSADEIVEDPTESEATEVVLIPEGDDWNVVVSIEMNDSVTLQVKPREQWAHAKLTGAERNPVVYIDQEGYNTNSEVRTDGHNTQNCYSSYTTCYGGYAGGGILCYLIEVHNCPSGCLTRVTTESCSSCEADDPYPCQ